MFEHHKQPLLPRPAFVLRVLRHGAFALGIILVALGIGVAGYHQIGRLPWIDALVNAAMILGGMGPVNELETGGAKLFASFYALFSGLVFLVIVGVIFAPMIHRFLHHFHLGIESDEPKDE
jgi:hypothetical protein